MCLYIDKTVHQSATPWIADRPLTVYKIVELNEGRIESPYYGKVYALDDEAQSFLGVYTYEWVVEEGFHSYSKLDPAQSRLRVMKAENAYIVSRQEIDPGMVDHRLGELKIAVCTIPRGAKYLIGEDSQIVSDRIVLDALMGQ